MLSPLQAKPAWKVYAYIQSGHSAAYLNSLPYGDITHMMDAFGLPTASPSTIDLSQATGANLVNAAHSNSTRANLSIGGAGATLSNFVNNTSTLANRNVFVAAITNTVQAGNYDGVDIDWEFPTSGQKAQFMAFMQQLYNAIKGMPNAYDGQPRDLTFFISAGGSICGVDWSTIGLYCDAGIMSGYDYFVDNYNGPLSDPGVTYGDCNSQSATADIQGTYAKLIGAGMSSSKLALGCPLYGAPSETAINLLLGGSGTGYVYHSPQQEFSITYAGNPAWADDATSYCAKINWMKTNGLQGIGLWEVSYAWPASSAAVTSIWDTIGGIAACVSSGSPTDTRTPTGTATRSATATATRTASPTPTQTATNASTPRSSATPSATASRTASPGASPSGTPTATRSATATPSRTATSSATASITPPSTTTFSPTATTTRTATATRTTTGTATASGTSSATSTVSPPFSATDTPTATETASISPTSSATPSATVTGTVSSTATVSPPVSPTDTPTATETASISPTDSATPSSSVTGTPSATSTVSPPFSPTDSPSTTATPSASPSGTPSATPSDTGTTTATSSVTALATITSTLTQTPLAVASATSTSTITSASTPIPSGSDPPKPKGTCALPNPQMDPEHLTLGFRLEGDADDVRVELYAISMVKILQKELPGAYHLGWNQVRLSTPHLPAGIYYAVVYGKHGSAAALRGPIAKVQYIY